MSLADRDNLILEVPIFHPTAEEFQNLVQYVQKISPVAEKVGLCKICPPTDWLPPCLIDDDFQFTASAQHLGRVEHTHGNGADEWIPKTEFPSSDEEFVSKRSNSTTDNQSSAVGNQCTILSFGEMADDFKRNYFKMPVDRVPDKLVEQEFWRVMSSSAKDVVVYHGCELVDTSAFPRISSKTLFHDDLPYLDSNWNLNNVAGQSVLRYLTHKIPMKFPKCSIGMCFSYSPWQTEDYWSYSINYLHWGENQTWYCVPGSALDSFDKYVEDHDQTILKNATDRSNDQGVMFDPEDLLARGIAVATVVQQAGEFVLTFPRSIVAQVSHGFNLKEKVNFCPNSWLPIGKDFSKRQQRLAKPCIFSYEELLFRILLHVDSLDTTLVNVAYEVLSIVKEEELEATKRVATLGLTKREREIFELLPNNDRSCYVCRKICFLSAVTCQCDDKLVCLDHVAELCQCAISRRCLHYRYASDEIESKLEHLQDRMREYERWVQKVNDTLNATDDEKKLDLVQMKQLKAKAIELYPQSHLVTSLQQVIADAQTYASFARKSICSANCQAVVESCRSSSSGSLSSKLSIEELQSFFKMMTKIPVRMKEMDSVATILEAAVQFQTRLQAVISGSIPDCSTLEELVSSLRGMPVSLPETAHLQQLVEQRKWLDGVERRLVDPSQVTIDLIGKLIEEGISIHPHPSCEKMLGHLQQLQSICSRLEDRAKHCLETKPSSPLSVVEALLDEASKLPVHLPAILELKEAAETASEWLANVENILNGQCSPYLIEVEKCLQLGHSIPIQLEKVVELESLIAKAEDWIDRTSKAFIRKNSVYSLYEILCPRTDIGTLQSYKIRRKKVTDVKVGSTTGLPVHWLLSDLNLDYPDPATVAAAFKMAELKEVEDIVTLRNANLKKLSSDSSSAKYCLCRQGKTSNMMQCELCKEIFHSACVTLPKSFQCKSGKTSTTGSSSSELKFFCPMCMRSRRPRLETIIGLLLDLGKFPIRLPEGEALQSLAEHAFSWQDRARRLLATDELSRALARLTVLNQQMAEHAAKVKTEKIIRSELLKAAKHRHAKHSMEYEYVPTTSSVALCTAGVPASVFEGAKLPLQDVEVQMRVTALGGMPFEHAYSSASKHNQLTSGGQHLRRSGSDEPVLELSESTLCELKQLIIEGDLLELSLDETHHLWKIVKACQPSQAETQRHASDSSGDFVAEPDDKPEKVIRRKRKASHNMKVDESFEDEAICTKPMKQMKTKHRKDKGWSVQEKKFDKNLGEKNAKLRLKPVKREKNPAGLDSDGKAAKNSEDCEANKCLRPLGNAVKWVQCDGCEKWYHYYCLGLSKRDVSEYKEFLCRHCLPENRVHVPALSDGSRCSSTSTSSCPTMIPFQGGFQQ